MSILNRKNLSKEDIVKAIADSQTMGAAAKLLHVDWRTFRWNAEKYGLYNPVPASWKTKYELQDILDGKHPQYSSWKLTIRLVKEGFKEYKCEKCNAFEWMGERLSLELNHIDGDNSNHSLENLELLCPNCHSITPTFRNKRGKK